MMHWFSNLLAYLEIPIAFVYCNFAIMFRDWIGYRWYHRVLLLRSKADPSDILQRKKSICKVNNE